MSIRTTITLDDDVVARLKDASAAKGVPFKQMVNDTLRSGLIAMSRPPAAQPFTIKPVSLGQRLAPDIENTGKLIAWAEGDDWR